MSAITDADARAEGVAGHRDDAAVDGDIRVVGDDEVRLVVILHAGEDEIAQGLLAAEDIPALRIVAARGEIIHTRSGPGIAVHVDIVRRGRLVRSRKLDDRLDGRFFLRDDFLRVIGGDIFLRTASQPEADLRLFFNLIRHPKGILSFLHEV